MYTKQPLLSVGLEAIAVRHLQNDGVFGLRYAVAITIEPSPHKPIYSDFACTLYIHNTYTVIFVVRSFVW